MIGPFINQGSLKSMAAIWRVGFRAMVGCYKMHEKAFVE